MAYKPKSKRTNSPAGPQGKKVLDGLTANKNIDDIRALSKISNTQSISISTLNTGLSAANKGISQLSTSKQNKLTLTTNGTSGPATLNNNTLNVPNYSTGLTVGSTPIAGGAVGRILFEGTGNVLQESANLFWDQTNNILKLGSLGTNGEIALIRSSTGTSVGGIKAEVSGAGTHIGGGGYLDSIIMTNGSGIRLNTWSGSGSSSNERLRITGTTGNILINTTTDAGYRLDVNGTARVQGVITGSVSAGSLTLGAASANQTAIAVTGYFTGNGAITTSNSNPRGFNANIGAQNTGITLTYNGVAQGQTVISSYFLVSGNINLVDGAIDLNGFNFTPTIVSEVGATIKAFSSGLSAASNHYNLYLSGTAKNYIQGSLLLGTSTDAGYKLDVNGTSRFSGLTDFNADIVLNSNRIFMQSNSGNVLLRMIQTNNLQIYNNNASATLYLDANGSVQIGQTNAINWATFSASGHTIFGSTNTNFFSSGNIGVNTATDAGYKLDVNGTFRSNAIWTNSSAVTYWGIGSSATEYGVLTWGTGYATVGATAGNVLYLTANGGSARITIDTSGNVGIGTTSPSQVFHVAGNTRITGAIYDSTNSPGTSGQVLSSTVTGTAWVAAGGGGGTIYKLTAQTLTAVSWTLVSGYYQYTFSNVNITTNTRVDFTPDNASYTEVTTCGMLTEVDVASGSCTFYSLFPPQSNITGEITIFPTV